MWQHIVLCKSTLLGMRPAMVCAVCYVVKDKYVIYCICWLIIKVILRNARCNNEDKV